MKIKDPNKDFWKDCFLTEYYMGCWASSIAKGAVPTTNKGIWFTNWPHIAELFILAEETLKESE